ncbi:MAG: phage tail tip lysozyme [Polyangiales bacterium]
MTTIAILRRASLVFVAPALALILASCGDAPESTEPLGTTSEALFANDKKSFDYFVSKGLTAFQAAGIVGNLDQESGDSPTAVQPGGPGRGLAQWSAGGRWDTDKGDNATAYASSHGMSVWSLDLQLDFIWYELTNFPGYGLAALKATTNVTDATVVFQNKFEGCGTCVETQRVTYAKAVLAAYGAAPPYAAAFVSQSFPLASTTMTMSEGEVVPSYIELKNVGTKTWDSKTFIGTTQPRDRKSAFADASWTSATRLAGVVGTVAPGATYKFKFNLKAPDTAGSYDEFFGVVQEGVAWFSDPGQGGPPDNNLEVKVQVVTPKYRGVFKDQSFPLAPAAWTVHQGDVAKGWIELTNKGTATWKAGTTKLATIPRDMPSPFADSSWLSPTRVSTIAADVAPGEVGRFDVALDAKSLGDTTVKFGLVEDGDAWFADPGQGGPADGFLAAHFVVVASDAPLDAGPVTDDAGGVGEDGGEGGLDPASANADVSGSASCNASSRRSGDAPWIGVMAGMLLLAVRSRRRG